MPENGLAEKAFLPEVSKVSVIDLPPEPKDGSSGYSGGLVWLVGQLGQEVPAWGTNIIRRDQMLRELPPKEPMLSGALATVIARNAAMDWELDGPRRIIKTRSELLHNANFGRGGWLGFATRFSFDYYTQDKGAFVEIIKENPKDPLSPTIGIANLDSQRCWHTGNPEWPVLYHDRKNRIHRMPWFRVWTSGEMLTPHEVLYGLQTCAITRLIEACQTQISFNTYAYEKASGRHTNAIQLVGGISSTELQKAVTLRQTANDQIGLRRYSQPAIVAGIDPSTNIQVATVQLASLPDNFNAMNEFQKYIAILAMCFLTDYLELAPLPGNNLGTATQAETADKKSKAKGAQIWRKSVACMMNFSGILPRNVEFGFSDFDPERDETDEGLRLARAQRRTIMIANGEIDAHVARQMALDVGDISQEIFDAMIASEEVEDVTGVPEETEIDDTDSILDDEEQPDTVATKATVSREVTVERDPQGRILSVKEVQF